MAEPHRRQMPIRAGRDFGLAVAEARAARGLGQQAVAESIGVDRTYLARIENGMSVLLLDRVIRVLRRLGAEITVTLPSGPTDPAASKDTDARAGEEGCDGPGA